MNNHPIFNKEQLGTTDDSIEEIRTEHNLAARESSEAIAKGLKMNKAIEKIADLITVYCNSCPYVRTCVSLEGEYCQLCLEQATVIYDAGYRLDDKPSTAREALAELEHEQWIAWATSLMSAEDLTPERIARWVKLCVPYSQLTEGQKDQDRIWADKALSLIEPKVLTVLSDETMLKMWREYNEYDDMLMDSTKEDIDDMYSDFSAFFFKVSQATINKGE